MSTAKLNAEQRETVHQMVLDVIKPYGLQPAPSDSPLVQRFSLIKELRAKAYIEEIEPNISEKEKRLNERHSATIKTSHLNCYTREAEVCLEVKTSADLFGRGPAWVDVAFQKYVYMPKYQRCVDWLFRGCPKPFLKHVGDMKYCSTFGFGMNLWDFTYKVGEQGFSPINFQSFVKFMEYWPLYMAFLDDDEMMDGCLAIQAEPKLIRERLRNKTMPVFMECLGVREAVPVFLKLYHQTDLEQAQRALTRLAEFMQWEHREHPLNFRPAEVRENMPHMLRRMQLWLDILRSGGVPDFDQVSEVNP